MKDFTFPIFKTKIDGVTGTFQLEDPASRKKYFEAKAGQEIEYIRTYLEKNTFIAFTLGKKNSGKGTYSKLFMEAVGKEHIAHISVGDIVRAVHSDLSDEPRKNELVEFLKKRYRGFITIEQALDIIMGRDTTTLLPTEITLALIEREIDKLGRKAVFIDGFPRNLDQVSYSLFFRSIIGYRDDPDFFVFIDVPKSVIDERMKYRVICPVCHVPRNTRLLRTKDVGYNVAKNEFYLICDNEECGGVRMVAKEGDELGIEAIRDRIEADGEVMNILRTLEGVPKVYLRNAIPVDVAKDYVDDYEITPSYRYEWDKAAPKVQIVEEPWIVKDEAGAPSYSLLPGAVAVSLIKQTATVLGFSA